MTDMIQSAKVLRLQYEMGNELNCPYLVYATYHPGAKEFDFKKLAAVLG